MTAPTPNAELAYRVLDHIDAHPEEWDQTEWQCGTAACFAGWAVRFSGGVMGRDSDATVISGPPELIGMVADGAALKVLRITERQAGWLGDGPWLFDGDNTRADLGRLVAEIFGPRPRSCCASTVDVGHDFTCPVMLAEAGVSLPVDDVPPNAGSAS